MARRTWILILLIISIFGVSFIGIQVFVYRKCVSALEKISLPSTTVTLKKFNFQIHRSRLLLSGISFKSKTTSMEIEKLNIQFHPSGFTEDQLIINNVRIEGLLLPKNYPRDKLFFEFFKSNIEVSKSSLPMTIEKLIISHSKISNKRINTRKKSTNTHIERYKLKSKTSKLNGSMDFLVQVIYFILQNSLTKV